MKEIKLKDIPIKTMDGVPLKIGMKVFAVGINEPYRAPFSLKVREYIVEYINTTGRTYMVRESSKGLELKFSCKCHFYSSIEAGKKALRPELKDKIKEIKNKIKYHNINLSFLTEILQ